MTIYETSSGVARPGSGERCAAPTRFQLASVSKQFTAAAVLLLAERGLVSVDDPITRWFADTPSEWRGITIHQLMTHTSGLCHWHQLEDFDLCGTMEPDEEIARFQRQPLLFAPGSSWHYSSPAFVLLAHVVQRAGDEPYGDFLGRELFAKAGLADTFVGDAHGRERTAEPTASGEPVRSFSLDVIGMGAGDVWSTTADLARWTAEIAAGHVLGAQSTKMMYTPHASVAAAQIEQLLTGDFYGYGVYLGAIGGRALCYHPGDNSGFTALAAYVPDDGLTAVVLSNDESTDVGRVALDSLGAAGVL